VNVKRGVAHTVTFPALLSGLCVMVQRAHVPFAIIAVFFTSETADYHRGRKIYTEHLRRRLATDDLESVVLHS
jgi:hypothetical protein